MTKQIETEQSSGNVFADLDMPNAQERLTKADLAIKICEIIQKRSFTQVQAAKFLKIPQSSIVDLVRGKLEKFTIDELFRLLNALDQDVQIVIRSKHQTHPLARTFVVKTPQSSKTQTSSEGFASTSIKVAICAEADS